MIAKLQWYSGLLVLAFILFPFTATAQTVSGSITADTTWTGTVVADSVYLPAGKTLTIQPGTIIKFTAGKTLVIAGVLNANGTSASRIVFTSNAGTPAAGDWNGIEIQASANSASILNYCTIEYAGKGSKSAALFYNNSAPALNVSNAIIQYSAGDGINILYTSPRISSSSFRQNGKYGINANGSLSFTIDSCTVSSNTLGGIIISTNSTGSITNCAIDSNGIGILIGNSAAPVIQKNRIRRNNIGIQFSSLGSTQPTISQDTITNNITWGFLNTASSGSSVLARNNYWGSDMGPYHASLNPTGAGDKVSDRVDFQPWSILAAALPVTQIAASTTISADVTWASGVYWLRGSITVNAKLTINPGVIVKFAPNARMTVNGSLLASGTANNLIVFTSEKDDPYGGDSNGDVNTSIPGRGDWDMVYLNAGGNSSSILTYCLFRYGGSSSNGNIRLQSCAPVISYVTSTQSSNYGLYSVNSSPTISYSTFSSNNNHGLFFYNGIYSIYAATISNNGGHGIYADGNGRFSVRKSTITGNSYGVVADGGTASATLTSLDSSIVSFNFNGGVYAWYGTGKQIFAYNRIEGNPAYGIWCFNVDTVATFVGDTLVNNGNDGIVTSKASISNCVIQGNRYPIALIGRVGTSYNGNTISGNKYNNAIALRVNRGEETLRDTLRNTFPSGMTSNTYVFIEYAPGVAVSSGTTLVILPGAIIKMESYTYFRVDGTLIANGTIGNPIVFTSYRDASYGGKTNLATDLTAPAPNDWRYVRLYTANASASILNNVIFKYGGDDGYGNLYISNGVVLTNSITNIVSRKSSSMGIRVYDSQVIFNNAQVDSNATHGILIEGNRPSDVTVRNSTIQDNSNGQGLRATDNSTFREVSNSIIRRNNGWGIGVDNGTLDQVFQGNTISNNISGGIWNNSLSIPATNLIYRGNIIADNGGEGILTTRARIASNTIQRNRFPLAVWKRTGNIYTNDVGIDDNIISDNVYNNAIAIWNDQLYDTLKAVFPVQMTSKTYVCIDNFNVPTGTTLIIEPGITVKFQPLPGNYRRCDVNGTIIAIGTPANPIVFTSWRDNTAGGKTSAASDNAAPAPGDWQYFALRNGSGASIVQYCQFRYGGGDGSQALYFDSNVGGVVFSNNLIRKSSSSGIRIYNTLLTIDSTKVDSSTYHGIYLNGIAGTNLILKNSKLLDNGRYGLWAESPSKVSVVSNCEISRNGYTGVVVENNSVPLSFIGNTVNNNHDHGLYLNSVNDAFDSLITIAGNRVRNNGITGIYSSRAYIANDSITGNRYPVGLVGQMSLINTGTANGNVYSNNVVTGNVLGKTLVVENTFYGKLGYSFLEGDSAHVVAVRGSGFVPSGSTLTIAPGTVIKFPGEFGTARIEVQGTVKSEGIASNKIVFTSWRDDTYGGDTNADSNATVPAQGNWDSFWMNGSGANNSRLLHTIARYGGSSGYANIRINSATGVAIDSSISSYSSSSGIYLYSSSATINGSDFHHNVWGFELQGASGGTVANYNNISDNSQYGLYNNTGSTINAQNNYWGTNLGPYINQGSDQNLSGTGNRIYLANGAVTYRPYLTSRTGVLLGDVTLNGTISPLDASMILRYVVDAITLNSTQLAAAEVSGDGSVSALDASFILRYVVGLISGFPRLGKIEASPALASSYELSPVRHSANGEYTIAFSTKQRTSLSTAEIHLRFDSNAVELITVEKTAATENAALEYHVNAEGMKLALATGEPIQDSGELVQIRFRPRGETASSQAPSVQVDKFTVNDVDLLVQMSDGEKIPELSTGVPVEFGLQQNYPNPFNPTTTINYQLPASSRVTVKIFDVLGQQIRTLVQKEQSAGYYRIVWDGRNDNGTSVSSNFYFCRIDATGGTNVQYMHVIKMLLMK
ncbi:MAG: right-handed parallel beta-helix repeat-containing protein [bacterium]